MEVTPKSSVDKNVILRPTWVEDSKATNCYNCKAEFGMVFTRRHHCRGCGNVFCHYCSNLWLQLGPGFGYAEPQRVCETCFKALSKKELTPESFEETLHLKIHEPEDEPPTPAVLKAITTLEETIAAYEAEKGKGTLEEITKFRELVALVDEHTTRLFRLKEEKLLYLFDLLLEQVFYGSQFEHRVVELFSKFIERESLVKPLKKKKLVPLQFGRRFLGLSKPTPEKKEKFFLAFLNFCRYFPLDHLLDEEDESDSKFLEELRNYMSTLPFEAQAVFPGLKSTEARTHTRAAMKILTERFPPETKNFTILLVGKTGVGKSTIFNEVMNNIPGTETWSDEAPGGKSVTNDLKKASIKVGEERTLTLIDSPGLDCNSKMQGYVWEKVVERIMNGFDELHPAPPIDVIWYCILSSTNRIDSVEEEWIRTFSQFVPVVIVLTKCSFAITQQFEEWLDERDPPLTDPVTRIVKLHARPTMLLKQAGGNIVPAFGFEELINETLEHYSDTVSKRTSYLERVKNTTEADLLYKRRVSIGWIVTASTTAAAAGAVPIPFADAFLLVPIHVGMLSAITSTYGAPLDRAFLTTVVGTIFGSGGALVGGGMVVESLIELLKIVPGLNVASMVISSTTAAFFTTALGLGYLAVMENLVRGHLMGIDPCRIQEMIIKETKDLLSKGQDEVMKQFNTEKAKVEK